MRPADPGRADAELLVASPLFDHGWYSLLLGRQQDPLDRTEAVAHYLEQGRELDLTPHPLFDPETFARARPEAVGQDDPLCVYLREGRFQAAVHPLFDHRAYLDEHPEALDHPDGPIGHYRDVGAAAGFRVNDWYEPDPVREPGGLLDWLVARGREHARLHAVAPPLWTVTPPATTPAGAPSSSGTTAGVGAVSVLLVAERDVEALSASVASVLGQTHPEWELWVLATASGPDPATWALPADDRVHRVEEAAAGPAAARNLGLGLATGELVAHLVEGDRWEPGRLAALGAAVRVDGSWAQDVARDDDPPEGTGSRFSVPATLERLLAGGVPGLGTVMTTRTLARAVGFDEAVPHGATLAHVLGLAEQAPGAVVPAVGVHLGRPPAPAAPSAGRPFLDHTTLDSWNDVVLAGRLVDWAALEERGAGLEPGLASVVVPTHRDWRMTRRAVLRVLEAAAEAAESAASAGPPAARVEVVVVDNGCPLVAAAVLDALAVGQLEVRVLRHAANLGFALGNDTALTLARGDRVVFLNNDTEVEDGWLEPLLAALEDPGVLAAQALLLYPGGAVQSAGVTFPRGGGLPHMLLQGFPAEDAAGLETEDRQALTGACLAMRFEDVVALRGFDPVFRNGMEDVDLSLRLRRLRAGRLVVLPDSRVLHHESRSPGRYTHAVTNRAVLLDRWAGRLPQDDVETWAARGYDVLRHEVRQHASPDRRLCVAEPVLRRRRAQVHQAPPRLRWALKNPARYGARGDTWGDTHFAAQLAEALRGLGQEVVVDRRGEFERPSSAHDDVVVLLRGLVPLTPMTDQVNLLWLISHPELFGPAEALGWDRIYTASPSYAVRLADDLARAGDRDPGRVTPLLQATDPSLFHPDLAEPDSGESVLFVGSHRGAERPLLGAALAAGLPVGVYGRGWEGVVPPELVRADYLPNDRLGAAYRAAGVVLADHWADMRAEGFVSNRLFDAVAAGARVVSDDVAGLGDVLDDVPVARDEQELSRLVRHPDPDRVFGTDQQRRDRAARVAAEHSFAARARTLLADACEERSRRGLE